jgi:hypothetical protein
LRFFDSHLVANGAEQISGFIRSGECNFVQDSNSFD